MTLIDVTRSVSQRPFLPASEPFSRGVLQRSLLDAGLGIADAIRCAAGVQDQLPRDAIDSGGLASLTYDVVRGAGFGQVAARYDGLRRLRRSSQPYALLVGGASGAGKSTVAFEVARRCGIVHIVATDAVRRALRVVHARELSRPIHFESFDVPGDDAARQLLSGFAQQAGDVVAAARAMLDQAAIERWPTLLEGVHLLPGVWEEVELPVAQVVLAVADEERHRANFMARGMGTGGRRPADHYLANFSRVRAVQQYLCDAAAQHGVVVVDSSDRQAAVLATIDGLLDRLRVVPR